VLYPTEGPEGGYRLTPDDPSFEEKMAKAEAVFARYRDGRDGPKGTALKGSYLSSM